MKTLRHTMWVVMLAAAGISAGSPSTAIVEAARGGDAQAVRALLQQKSVDVNAAAVDGTTALHWAAEHDDTRMVEMLIRAGARVRAANRYGVEPLALAAVN